MRTKADITAILAKFSSIASYDSHLEKYYLVFPDKKRGGIYTLMKKEEQWSIHGKGEDYCDEQETFLSEKEVVDFLWKNRAAFRKSLLASQK
ncbi:MAG: hypothetical protein ACE3JP_04045 [Ectobacillus sp.]